METHKIEKQLEELKKILAKKKRKLEKCESRAAAKSHVRQVLEDQANKIHSDRKSPKIDSDKKTKVRFTEKQNEECNSGLDNLHLAAYRTISPIKPVSSEESLNCKISNENENVFANKLEKKIDKVTDNMTLTSDENLTIALSQDDISQSDIAFIDFTEEQAFSKENNEDAWPNDKTVVNVKISQNNNCKIHNNSTVAEKEGRVINHLHTNELIIKHRRRKRNRTADMCVLNFSMLENEDDLYSQVKRRSRYNSYNSYSESSDPSILESEKQFHESSSFLETKLSNRCYDKNGVEADNVIEMPKCNMGLSQGNTQEKLSNTLSYGNNTCSEENISLSDTAKLRRRVKNRRRKSMSDVMSRFSNINLVIPRPPSHAYEVKDFELPLKQFGELVQLKVAQNLELDSDCKILSQSIISAAAPSPKVLRKRISTGKLAIIPKNLKQELSENTNNSYSESLYSSDIESCKSEINTDEILVKSSQFIDECTKTYKIDGVIISIDSVRLNFSDEETDIIIAMTKRDYYLLQYCQESIVLLSHITAAKGETFIEAHLMALSMEAVSVIYLVKYDKEFLLKIQVFNLVLQQNIPQNILCKWKSLQNLLVDKGPDGSFVMAESTQIESHVVKFYWTTTATQELWENKCNMSAMDFNRPNGYINSLKVVTNLPNALAGLSETALHLWSYSTGCLLMEIDLCLPITTCTSVISELGLLFLVIFSKECSEFGLLAVNPKTHKSLLVSQNKAINYKAPRKKMGTDCLPEFTNNCLTIYCDNVVTCYSVINKTTRKIHANIYSEKYPILLKSFSQGYLIANKEKIKFYK